MTHPSKSVHAAVKDEGDNSEVVWIRIERYKALLQMVRFWLMNLKKGVICSSNEGFCQTLNLARLPIPPSGLQHSMRFHQSLFCTE
jgi:hypothetical protein